MSAPIRPKPPSVCNRELDTAPPSRAWPLACYDGRETLIFDHLAREQHLNLAGEPEAVPLHSVTRVRAEEFDRLVALDKRMSAALAALTMMRNARRAVRR